MGLIHADILLQNSADVVMVNRGIITDDKVRQMNVKSLVDTGAITLTINEDIAKQLDLDVQYQVDIELADGTQGRGDVVGPVNIRFENRMTACLALVLPGATDVLLGAIPLEGMDVLIDPTLQRLIVHPERPMKALLKVK
jgi:clan AA aspartic protease